MTKIGPVLLDILPDVCLLVGGVAVVRGVALVSGPVAWIVAGVLLLAAGWRLGRFGGRKAR